MATYVMLLKYTQKGIENIKQSPARLDEAKKASKAVDLVSSLQNIEVLLRYGEQPKRSLSVMSTEGKRAFTKAGRSISDWMKGLIWSETKWILSPDFAIPGSQKN